MGKKKVLLTNIAPDRCEISKLNTRQTYDGDETIVELAEEMKLHRFEPTRALWGYSEEKDGKDGNYKYEIFAGGRRLSAAKGSGVSVAVLKYEGYDDNRFDG